MAQSNITVMKCDRCGTVEELRRLEQGYAWGRVLATQCNGPIRISAWPPTNGNLSKDGKDLCPACIRSLGEWWDNAGTTDDQKGTKEAEDNG